MEDISKRLNELLASPNAMESIRGVIDSLGTAQSAPAPSGTDAGLDMQSVMRIKGMLDAAGKDAGDDPRIRLVRALRPYMSPKRAQSIDAAERLLMISAFVGILKKRL